jgi:DNA segregation ATPase FtsK/SpoIIIE-like protein
MDTHKLFELLQIKYIDGLTPPMRLSNTPIDLDRLYQSWDIFKNAVWLIINERKAAVSVLQTKLKLSYVQAALLIDYMEHFGLIGPFELKREIYVELLSK